MGKDAEYFDKFRYYYEDVISRKGMLCIGCLESRLGRELKSRDFSNAPINWDQECIHSERLESRLYSFRPDHRKKNTSYNRPQPKGNVMLEKLNKKISDNKPVILAGAVVLVSVSYAIGTATKCKAFAEAMVKIVDAAELAASNAAPAIEAVA